MPTRQNIAPPNLVIAPKEYEQRYQDQLNNVQRLFYAQIANAINSPLPYGSFITSGDFTNYDSAGNSTANQLKLVPFSTQTDGFNTKIGNIPTRLYVAETGVYNVQFSAQCDLSSGSQGAGYFWLRKNGENIPATTGKVVVAIPNAETMAAWNYVLVLQAGDYIELAWESSDVHFFLTSEAANTIRPSLPAVILTITWVSSYNTSVGIS